ncbi:MAG: CocE/NonD family hydrolase [Crocinitomicaceae bacterium]|nr:CocE/NonD family hydrolase [Crocinitomicaceae bacterium]
MMIFRIPTLIAIIAFSCVSLAQMTPTLDDITINMRDGELLEADVYIPSGVDSAEVILIQTPYNKDFYSWSLPMGVGTDLDLQPYIWVIVDWRGFYGSNGADLSNFTRGEDGYDVCEWISEQSWHKDRIGTWGPSALGGVQYNTAREQHPNHTCAVPLVAHPQQSYNTYFFGGVLEEARLEQLDALGYGLSPLILANTYYNALWSFSENNTWYPEDIIIPTLQIGGWYDHNIDIMMDWYEATRTSADISVKDEQWLLVGPWVHGGSGAAYVGSSAQGELNYPNAEFVSDNMAWDFLEYYLLDSTNNWQNTDLITYYKMGENQWASSNLSNIEIANEEVLYLSENGQLISTTGNSSTPFISDPHSPSPTIGGPTLNTNLDQGPYNQNSLDTRTDIITFETENLTNAISISGRVKTNLYVECDQPDADISIRLVDLYPDGRSMLITDGIQRIRFREGYSQADEAFMTAGNIYNVEVKLPFTNYTWKAGHQIKIYVGGNNSNRFDVNLQNGGIMYIAGDTNIANVHIHHDATYPSRLILPGDNGFLNQKQLEPYSFKVFPNPTSNILTVTGNTIIDKIEVIDVQGKSLITKTKNFTSIETSSLESGVYIIRIYSRGISSEKRFVKL